jgi:hypothetical protein
MDMGFVSFALELHQLLIVKLTIISTFYSFMDQLNILIKLVDQFKVR